MQLAVGPASKIGGSLSSPAALWLLLEVGRSMSIWTNWITLACTYRCIPRRCCGWAQCLEKRNFGIALERRPLYHNVVWVTEGQPLPGGCFPWLFFHQTNSL
ncbi:hypothetical protein F5Y18DRAFT_112123 [Xylariaceae sp. FL1019]|nr:hypothetical protein F5Y18DRAFT_112123 [Xylariaceae sp. FL1019]